MDLRLLRYFLACVEHKSMHAAAESLCVSQPALSKAVRGLETSLGVDLLERRPRGVAPTSYGLTLCRYAKMIEKEVRSATAEIDAMRGATKGEIVIGAIPSLINSVLIKATLQLMSTHRRLKIKIRPGVSTEMMARLFDGELDLLLGMLPSAGAPPGLQFEPLLRTDPSVVGRIGHPLTRVKCASLRDLRKFRWLIPEFPLEHRQTINKTFIDAGLPPPESALEVSFAVFFASLISETDLLTIMPLAAFGGDPGSAGLAAIRSELNIKNEQAGLAYRSSSGLLPGARVLISSIRAVCMSMPNRISAPAPAPR